MLKRSQFLDYIDKFKTSHVLVIGPAVAEIDVQCQVTHIAADRTMPVYQCQSQNVHPGSAALTAATITNLGGKATLLAPVGQGLPGTALRAILESTNVKLIHSGNGHAHTPELFRYVTKDSRQLLQIRRNWNPESFVNLTATLNQTYTETHTKENTPPSIDCICIVDALPASLTETDIKTISDFAKKRNLPVIYDAAGANLTPPSEVLSAIDHIIVNETESHILAEKYHLDSNDNITRLCNLAALTAQSVTLTIGKQGSMIATHINPNNKSDNKLKNDNHYLIHSDDKHDINHINVPNHALADRRGVGFVYSGVFALAIAAGAAPAQAAFLASSAASTAIAIPGPKIITIDNLIQIAYQEIESQVADGIEVFGNIARDHLPDIDKAARLLLQAYTDGKQVLVFGNGGSAAEANHLVTELTGRFREKRPSLPSISLSSNDALMTCIANDYGYENVFAHQIKAFCRPGDVVIGMSTSGKSPNVVRAMQIARECNAKTIAFTGQNIGPINELADVSVAVPSTSTPRIQEAHLFVIHVMCEMLDQRLDNTGQLHPSASEI